MPAVSIIMPCYNAARFLPTSVGSVLAQTFPDWELIAVDDGSTDDTVEALAAFNDPRIRVLQQSNAGVSSARNRAISEAQSPYLAFLDADDTWAPEFLATMHAALRARADAVLAYCGWQNVGLPGPRGEPFIPPDYEGPSKIHTLFAGCRWPIHAALVSSDAVRRAGGFNPALTRAEDYLLWLEVAAQGQIIRVAEVLAFYHFHGDTQASADRGQAALQHLKAQMLFLGRHPDFARAIGDRRREFLYGELLQRGYECYWKRDLVCARKIFREVMKHGYGRPNDWLYMLPSWLPENLHRNLLGLRERLLGKHH